MIPFYESKTQSWRARWVQTGKKGRVLHRLASFDDPNDDWFTDDRFCASGTGTTVCGKRGEVCMPGIFSRIGAKRCPKCCRIVGIAAGNGVPYNDKSIPKRHPERKWKLQSTEAPDKPEQDK